MRAVIRSSANSRGIRVGFVAVRTLDSLRQGCAPGSIPSLGKLYPIIGEQETETSARDTNTVNRSTHARWMPSLNGVLCEEGVAVVPLT